MKSRVELIYDPDCPSIEGARKALLEAFAEAGVAASWTEWDRRSHNTPAYARQCGSPTILVNGRDVTGNDQPQEADSCRLYDNGSGLLRPVPGVSTIVAALRNVNEIQGVNRRTRR